MLGSLLKSGVEITNDAATADAVIVNTCSFIDSAQEESVDTILESVELREAANRGQAVIVSGCLPQRFRDELPKLLPEVDAFMGIDQVAQVGDIVGRAIGQSGGENAENPNPTVHHPTSKGKIVSHAERNWKRNAPPSDHEKENAIRGTDKFGKTKIVVGSQFRTPHSALRTFGSHPASDFHPRLFYAAFPPDAAPFRLRQDRRGLQSSVQFLHHSPNARFASQPAAGGHRRRGAGAHRRWREGNQFDFAGLDLLRAGFAPEPQPRRISSPEKFSATVKSLPPMQRPSARYCAN